MKKLICAVTVLAVSTVQADTINVPADQPTIQAGINAAVNGDEIIVAPDTYLEAINFLGKAITLRSSDGPEVTTINGVSGYFHMVLCVSGEGADTVFDGFTVTGGKADGGGINDSGGGMFNLDSSPTVVNCTFIGNLADSVGAGMFNDGSSPTVTGCTFSESWAMSAGGGMFNLNGSSPTVTNCTFSENEAFNAPLGGDGGGMANDGSNPTVTNCTFTGNNSGGSGGGMYNIESSPTVTNCTFSGNSAGSGGGMHNRDNSSPTVANCTFIGNSADIGGGMDNISFSSPTVNNCTFSSNLATNRGGGMSNSSSSSPTVTNCTFSGNSARRGGGMRNGGMSDPTVTGCTFIANTAFSTATSSGRGGGMYSEGSDPTVIDCIFSGNMAVGYTDHGGRGGAMYFLFANNATVTGCTFIGNMADLCDGKCDSGGAGGISTTEGNPTVTNCTFSGNSGYRGGINTEGGQANVTVINCVLWGDGPTEIGGQGALVAYSNVQGGYPGIGNIDADPLFVAPGNGNYRLQAGSPCIDAGDNTAVPSDITTDLDGLPRFVDTGLGQCPVDMGAYEFQQGDACSPCPWDCDGGESTDGTVGITDFLLLLAQWGGPGSCDFDGGGVGINDFLELLANWGPCP